MELQRFKILLQIISIRSSGKSVTDEERAIILNEFAKEAPDNVTTFEGCM